MLTAGDILSWTTLPPRLKGMKVTVLGLARSGRAVAELLLEAGCQVFVSDSAQNQAIQTSARELQALGVAVETGAHTERSLECDFLVRSPGVPADNPILIEAQHRDKLVVSEIEAASWFCPAPIIAVTGSNGKTTTTEWLGDLFRRTGRNVEVCGNVGRPFSAAVARLDSQSVAVVEVSSFQLENVIRFRPRAAVITNFSPDHLDRHDSYETYLAMKCRIFERQTLEDLLVYNRGDRELSRRVADAPGREFSFGLNEPSDSGAGLIGENVIIIDQDGSHSIIASRKVGLPGRHNLENALAVASVAWDLGVEKGVIAASLAEFPGVPHRLETVLESEGVLWVNDSKATNIASGLVALESYTRPIILLAGGRDKGSSFESISRRVAAKVRLAILFGEAGSKMEKAWAAVLPVRRLSSLSDAIRAAFQEAREGDVVLLSPMCASFDEFKNYEERGDKFREIVREICLKKA